MAMDLLGKVGFHFKVSDKRVSEGAGTEKSINRRS